LSSQATFFADVVRRLKAAGIPFMVSGSLASSVHGHPRATNDIDFVIDPTLEQIERLLASLPERWYVSEQAARDALRRRTMFNVVDTSSGWKADLIVRRDRPFSAEEFGRRRRVKILRRSVDVVTPEDTILSKLEWASETGSERQFADALGVALLRWDGLDQDYMTRWASELGVSNSLSKLLAAAREARQSRG
jgi:hypothetical protein